MRKRERLEKTLAGATTDRVPAALWRHWPGDDQRAADLAQSTLDYQRAFDWDIVRVTPPGTTAVIDFGVQDEWQGDAQGDRARTRSVVRRSLDWTEVRAYDPTRGQFGRYVEAVRLIVHALRDEDVPVIATLYSPLAQAARLAEDDLLVRHLRTQPDRLRTGLNTITDTLLRCLDVLKSTGVAGICYVCEHADYEALSEAEYQQFGAPYDRKVLETISGRLWFNVLHLHGSSPMLGLVNSFPVQAIQWDFMDGTTDLAKGRSAYSGVICGGLSSRRHLHFGTPTTVREAVRDTIQAAAGRRLVISAGTTPAVTTPWSNLRAVRDAVETAGR
jgi:uroporphyrinogen decarboxylase